MSIRAIIEGLAGADVAFVIVGMAAGQLHGSRLLTEDVDLVYKDDTENIAKMATYLKSIDASIIDLWPNEGGFEIEPASQFSADTLSREKRVTLRTREGEIDLLHRIDGVGGYDEVLATSQRFNVGTLTPRVISLDGLIASKQAAGRPKDRLHLPDLECLREIKRQGIRSPKPPNLG